MKTILYIFLFLLISCDNSSNHESKTSSIITTDSTEQAVELVGRDKVDSIVSEPQTDTSWVHYKYQVAEDLQLLSVFWVSNDTIVFKLVTDGMVCLRKENGVAVLQKGAESDDDENGDVYLTSEYNVVHESKLSTIRIPGPERDKARITFNQLEPDECDPMDVLMRIDD